MDEISRKKEEWLEKIKREGKQRDPTEDHKLELVALQNKVRREIVKFIGIDNKKTVNEIKNEFNLKDSQVKLHLDLLEQALFVEGVEEEGDKYYVLTPRGEAYLQTKGGGAV